MVRKVFALLIIRFKRRIYNKIRKVKRRMQIQFRAYIKNGKEGSHRGLESVFLDGDQICRFRFGWNI